MGVELSHSEIQELLGAHALDAVSGEERRAVEAHLATCPRCRAEVAEHLEAVAMLAGGGTAPEGLWDRIAAALEEAPPRLDLERAVRPGRGRWRWVSAAVAAAAMVAAVVLGAEVVQQGQRIDRLVAESRQGGLAGVAEAALRDPSHPVIDLRSPQGDVAVRAVLLEDGTGYLVGDTLAALPSTRTYQLWALDGGPPISAGVLGPDPGIVAFRVEAGTRGLAITVERAGGVMAPSHDPLVVGDTETA